MDKRMVGRQILEDGVWVYVVVAGTPYMAKVSIDEHKKALAGEWFELWHAIVSAPGGKQLYLPAICETVEPWLVNGKHCATIVPLAEERAKELDDMLHRETSVVQVASASAMPMQTKGLKLV